MLEIYVRNFGQYLAPNYALHICSTDAKFLMLKLMTHELQKRVKGLLIYFNKIQILVAQINQCLDVDQLSR